MSLGSEGLRGAEWSVDVATDAAAEATSAPAHSLLAELLGPDADGWLAGVGLPPLVEPCAA